MLCRGHHTNLAGTHEASVRTRPSLMGPPARPVPTPFPEFESVRTLLA
jgi:hypothetical protein